MNAKSGRDDAELLLCDLGSLRSVRDAAAELLTRTPWLDVLVNNAGVITLQRELSHDGFEKQLAVNHLGHFALTCLLMPRLRESDDARVVVVSSGAHKIGRVNWDDLRMDGGFTVWAAYARSKLANLWFTAELARRLEGSSVTVNAFHPGAVATQLGVNRQTGFGRTVHRLLRPFFLTPERAAQTALHLATSPEIRGQSGGYYEKCRVVAPARRATDAAQARRLWSWSEEATGCFWQ